MKRVFLLLFALLAAYGAGAEIPGDKRSQALAKETTFFAGHIRVGALQPGVQCVVAGQIAYGQTVAGELTATDCTLSGGNPSYVDYWQFQGTAGDLVTIDMAGVPGAFFDTYLALLDATGVVVAQNDDFGSGTDSHIAFALTSTGTWVIGATSLLSQITGSYTLTLHATTPPPPPSCGNGFTLCLDAARFQVTVAWATTDGRAGPGHAISLSDDTGYFWFFDNANVELVVKVLDGRGVNGHFWVFYGALSDVQYTITVTDTVTHIQRSYANPQSNLASFADTSAF